MQKWRRKRGKCRFLASEVFQAAAATPQTPLLHEWCRGRQTRLPAGKQVRVPEHPPRTFGGDAAMGILSALPRLAALAPRSLLLLYFSWPRPVPLWPLPSPPRRRRRRKMAALGPLGGGGAQVGNQEEGRRRDEKGEWRREEVEEERSQFEKAEIIPA